MMRVIDNTINYFSPKRDYFWKWAENASVIEWRTQSATICYRDDLAYILRQFPEKLPRLGSVLLVMYACNNEIAVAEQFALRSMLGKERTVHVGRVKNAIDFLNMIHTLPPSFRSGTRRIQLVKEIFNDEKSLEIESSSISINELQSGRMDARLMDPQGYTEVADVMADLNCLIRASEKFPTYESLELFLKAGVESLPEPPAIEIPEEKHFNDLFDELLEDPETAGVSRLARRLLSVIHIPIHARAGGEDSYGGIADITNRGNYDKLLLSELAQDELLLTARLVNNEALYFRREEPPAKPRNRRVLLIDASIKMWGMPRVYAIAAALAFSRNSKHGEQIEAYVLKETTYEKISLADKDGVIDALTQLHPALHPGKALACAVRELSSGEETEFILFTEERQLKHAGFYADFFKVKEKISFAITVDREGDIRFAEYSNGHAKVLNEAKLDIDSLLKGQDKNKIPAIRQRQKAVDGITTDGLKFFEIFALPLLFLKRNILLNKRLVFMNDTGDAIVIDRARRVLLLTSGSKGAEELRETIEHGEYCFSYTPFEWTILVRSIDGKSVLKLYQFDLGPERMYEYDLLPEILGKITDAVFAQDGFLYLFSEFLIYKYNYHSVKLVEKSQYASQSEVKKVRASLLTTGQNDIGRMHGLMKSPSYQLLFNTSHVFINGDHELVWGNFSLKPGTGGEKLIFYHRPDNNQLVAAKLSAETFFQNTKVKCRKAEFPDGSIALMDKRGVLHLKSSDPRLPEIAVIAISNMPTTAWSSEGYYCGALFFIGKENERAVMPARKFYQKYMRPFIDNILHHATSPET